MLSVHTEDRLSPEAARLLTGDPGRVLFLRPLWMRALAQAYPRFRFRYEVLRDGGETVGVLPLVEVPHWGWREVVSLPFGTYGGPVLAPGVSRDGARALVDRFRRRAQGGRTARFEMTLFDPPPEVEAAVEEELGSYRVPAETWLIDLQGGPEALWRGYEGRARTSVRKARKAGVTVAAELGGEAVETLFRLHAAQGESRAVPWHHPRRALETVRDALGENARIWVARREGQALCAALVLYNPGLEVHPWVTGASDASRSVNAFSLLMHAAMEDAAGRGFRTWNFGPSAGSQSVSYFKASFGGGPHPLLRVFFEAGWIGWGRRLRPWR